MNVCDPKVENSQEKPQYHPSYRLIFLHPGKDIPGDNFDIPPELLLPDDNPANE